MNARAPRSAASRRAQSLAAPQVPGEHQPAEVSVADDSESATRQVVQVVRIVCLFPLVFQFSRKRGSCDDAPKNGRNPLERDRLLGNGAGIPGPRRRSSGVAIGSDVPDLTLLDSVVN